jgi:hypothetical protein
MVIVRMLDLLGENRLVASGGAASESTTELAECIMPHRTGAGETLAPDCSAGVSPAWCGRPEGGPGEVCCGG